MKIENYMAAFSEYLIFQYCSVDGWEKDSEHPSKGWILFICLTNFIYTHELNEKGIATDFALWVLKMSFER